MKLKNDICKLVVSFDRDWEEWSVKVWDKQGRRESADYYASDRADARDTARHMFDTSETWAHERPTM